MLNLRSSLQSTSMRNIVLGMCLANVAGIYGAYRHLNAEVTIEPYAAQLPQARHEGDDFFLSGGLPPVGLQPDAVAAESESNLEGEGEAEALTAVTIEGLRPEATRGAGDVIKRDRAIHRTAVATWEADTLRISAAFAREFAEPGVLSPLPPAPAASVDSGSQEPAPLAMPSVAADGEEPMPAPESVEAVDAPGEPVPAPLEMGRPSDPRDLPAGDLGSLPEINIAAATPSA